MEPGLAREFRKCHNVKSRANPNIQCPFPAIQGDYCSRHFKNPKPFKSKTKTVEPARVYTRAETSSVKKIQAFWKRLAPLRRYRLQGPAVNAVELSTNSTELYTLEPLSTIPQTYFMSFADESKSIWVFDIRTLVHSMATGFASQNPYNRGELTERTKDRIHARIAWLRRRKYNILHITTDILTPQQAWNQAVLDIFLKIESLGYYVSCDWYHAMNCYDHLRFYKKLFDLWETRLELTRAQKEQIIPGHMTGGQRVFRFDPMDLFSKAKAWWEKKNLALIESFITRAKDKEMKKLGAMYVLMALVQVSPPAARALPWIVEML
jgi:hypothetical protein